MARTPHWIEPHPHGIYVRPAKAWIDPSRPAERALITHGHADHARSGHALVWATPETLAIMALRYGESPESRAMAIGEEARIGDVMVSFHPAGHVLGSAQIRLCHAGETVVVTGDFKRRADPSCTPFEPVKCDILITEATFGLPVFRHPPIESELAKLDAARRREPDRAILVGAYALGKAQRIIAEWRRLGHHEPIYLHGALTKLCALYEEHGVALGDLRPVSEAKRDDLAGALVLAPPSALADRWNRRLPDPLPAMASGWMRIRQRARQRGVELPLVVSDHADWDELTDTIRELAPSEVWITHGREDALLRWCELHQVRAQALTLIGREDEAE